jgi:hypothetical protein
MKRVSFAMSYWQSQFKYAEYPEKLANLMLFEKLAY